MHNLTENYILITGVAGNIGSRLAIFLLKKYQNLKIIGIDNFLTGKKDNIQSIIENKNFIFFTLDCNKISHISKIFKSYKID